MHIKGDLIRILICRLGSRHNAKAMFAYRKEKYMFNAGNSFRKLMGAATDAAMLFSMGACGAGNTDGSSENADSTSSQPNARGGRQSGSHVLMAYYPATGHTADVAKAIADAANGDFVRAHPRSGNIPVVI